MQTMTDTVEEAYQGGQTLWQSTLTATGNGGYECCWASSVTWGEVVEDDRIHANPPSVLDADGTTGAFAAATGAGAEAAEGTEVAGIAAGGPIDPIVDGVAAGAFVVTAAGALIYYWWSGPPAPPPAHPVTPPAPPPICHPTEGLDEPAKGRADGLRKRLASLQDLLKDLDPNSQEYEIVKDTIESIEEILATGGQQGGGSTDFSGPAPSDDDLWH